MPLAKSYKDLWDAAPYILFPVGLVAFLSFEIVQVVRGRVHLSGIARAALELLILSPAIVLLILARAKISEGIGLNELEATVLRRSVSVTILGLIVAPWTHYRAKAKSPRRLGSASGDFTTPKDLNEPLPKEIEDEFYKP